MWFGPYLHAIFEVVTCSLCPALLPHDSFMTRVCWYLTHCVGLLCSMPSASRSGGGVGISSPPIADLLQNTPRGFQQRGPRTASSSLLKRSSASVSECCTKFEGALVGFILSKNMLMCFDAKWDYTRNAWVCSLRKLQLEMEMIFVLNTAHTSE